jgi:hypothetical protein
MRKNFTLILLLLVSIGINAQTIVSTSTENRNVILEEFTGMYCVFCPYGHRVADSIHNAFLDDVFPMAIHQSYFATSNSEDPDYRTEFGNDLASFAQVSGFPAGSINRVFFENFAQISGSAMSREHWLEAVQTVLEEESYVNLAVESEVNTLTRVLSIHVEAYYTGDSPATTNKLNVALLQNNVAGPQSGSTNNPDQINPEGTNGVDGYFHQHMLRHLLTGQWGDEITITIEGTFVDKTYNYLIPENINGVVVELEDLEVIAFVSENQGDIETGSWCIPLNTSSINNNDVYLTSVNVLETVCNDAVSSSIDIKNIGSETLTSLDVDYQFNDGIEHSITWTGSLDSIETTQIDLPSIPFVSQNLNTIKVTVSNPNGETDEDVLNNINTSDFLSLTAEGIVELELIPDDYGNETTWELKNSYGAILYSGGPYTVGNTDPINEVFSLGNGCYEFIIYDTNGDGISGIYGNGSYTLKNPDGSVLYFGDGFLSTSESIHFNILSTSQPELEKNEITFFPNPSTGTVNIINAKNSSLKIYNVLGKVIYTEEITNNTCSIDLSELKNGAYFISINNNKTSDIQKLILNK